MNRGEFSEKVVGSKEGLTMDAENWELISQIYQWHPAISDVNGKDEIVALFKLGGYGLLKEMLPVALKMQGLEAELMDIRHKGEQVVKEIGDLKKVYLVSYGGK